MRAGPDLGVATTLAGPVAPIGRLTRRAEFVVVSKGGRRVHSERVSVQGRRRVDGEIPVGLRVGFTVTKREGHATERNRIRRRLRAAASALGPSGAEALDLVLVGRRQALSAPFPALVADLRRALDRLAASGGGPSSAPRRTRTQPPSP